MKITIVQGAFLPVPPLMGGAVEKAWLALGAEFARRGHEIVHISRKYKNLPQSEELMGVKHIRINGYDTPKHLALLKLLDLFYSLRVVQVLRGLSRADILITNTFWLPILVRSFRFGKIYVHVARYPKGQMRFYSRAARLQTVSTPIAEAIIREAPQLRDKVRSIPNPLPDSKATASPPSREVKEKWILYAGRIHPEKGLGLLVDAISLVTDRVFDGWKMVIIGPWETKQGGGGKEYLADLKQRSRQDRIKWVDPVFDHDRLNEYYRKAALFVYPSLAERGETFGLAPLEAMACGCPPLVSSLACFQDFITEKVTGFFFDHRHSSPASHLAAKISELIENEALLWEIGLNAQRKAREYSVEKIADLYLADFTDLLKSS